MTGKFHIALLALAGKRGVFQATECLLLFSIKHVYQGFIQDISQFIFRENKVVAGEYIAIMFHHSGMTALLGIGADAWLYTYPVGQCAVEDFHKDFTYIMANPIIEDGTEEFAPLFRSYREIGNCDFLIFFLFFAFPTSS